MSFGSLFNQTLKDFKGNWKETSKLLLVFRGLPLLLIALMAAIFYVVDPTIAMDLAKQPPLFSSPHLSFMISSILTGIVAFLLYIFVSGAMTSLSLKKKKLTYSELTKEGTDIFFRYIKFSIVTFVFIILLLLLLIIPGIIFSIYWILGVYIFLDKKNIKITKALKESRKLIKGNWWRTFGYCIIIGLLSIAVTFIFNSLTLPVQTIKIYNGLNNVPTSISLEIALIFLKTISAFLAELIVVPLTIFFMKNYYFELAKKKI